MTTTASLPVVTATAERLRYGGLVVVMLMSFLLVTAEFLPNGVLTEMAASLGVTPGQAGQTVTVTAFVGLLVAPTVGLVFPRLDRRSLLVWMAHHGRACSSLTGVPRATSPVLAAVTTIFSGGMSDSGRP